MRIGIYSGSFNPVHVGHISLVEYIVKHNIVDQVWLIRSPQNPLKVNSSLLSDEHRAEMLRLATEGRQGLSISTIEDNLPKPNYTINTLRALQEQYPDKEFYLIIGADNWDIFDKWKDWDIIIRDFHLIVYPRPGYEYPEIDQDSFPTVQVVDAPQFDLSSTEIRDLIKEGEPITGYVDEKVEEYIIANNLYNEQ